MLHELGPDRIVKQAAALASSRPANRRAAGDRATHGCAQDEALSILATALARPPAGDVNASPQLALPHLDLPAHHDVRPSDVNLRRLHGALAAAADRGPKDFADLLRVPGVGARTILSLAMVAEVVHGAPCRFTDPARFSLAHGGKDRHPYAVPCDVYDKTLEVLKSAVASAKLGNDERLQALRRLDEQARRLERYARGPSLPAFIERERQASAGYGGRSIYGVEEEALS